MQSLEHLDYVNATNKEIKKLISVQPLNFIFPMNTFMRNAE